MGWQLHTSDTERSATIVEYAVLMSLLVLGLIPVVGLTTDAAGDAHDKSVSHFSTTASSYSEGGGGGGAGETTTTTTVAPTTTTTTIPPNQTQTVDYDDEIVRLRFTREDPYLRVMARGWLLDDPEGEDDGELKARTRELGD
jgi:hypothetical protein